MSRPGFGHDVGELGGDARDVWGVAGLRRGVGDAEAAAQVELRHRSAHGLGELAVDADEPPRGLAEAVGREDLRADVAVQPEEVEARVRGDATPELDRSIQRQTELLVLVRSGEEIVGRGVHTAVHPDAHALSDPRRGRGLGDPLDLLLAVEHDDRDADGHGVRDLLGRLVVAVESDPARVDAGGERDREFAAARDIDVEPLLGHPARHLDAQERLACVVHGRIGADAGELPLQGGAGVAGALTRDRLVYDVERRSEALDQLRRADVADLEHTAFAAATRGRGEHARLDLGGVMLRIDCRLLGVSGSVAARGTRTGALASGPGLAPEADERRIWFSNGPVQFSENPRCSGRI